MPTRAIHSWLMDMDGVLVREENAIPGADPYRPARIVDSIANLIDDLG